MTTSTVTARPALRRLSAVAAASAAAFAWWALADPVAGVDLTVRSQDTPVGPLAVVLASALAGLAGWGFLALLERRTRRSRTIFTVVAAVVLLISLPGPLAEATDAGVAALLAGMHVVVGAVLILLLPVRPTAPSSGEVGRP